MINVGNRRAHDQFSIDDEGRGQVPPGAFEEPATKKYRCSVTSSGQNDSEEGESRDVYYCMNVVIQSRAFEMNQEIIEGNIIILLILRFVEFHYYVFYICILLFNIN